MKKIMILMTALLGLFCQGEDGKCEDIGACNNCMKIYDFQGNYINGGPMSGSSPVYWDGRDYNGDTVPCGKYRVVYVMGGRQMESEIVVSRPGAVQKNSSSECDALKKTCTGFLQGRDNNGDKLSLL